MAFISFHFIPFFVPLLRGAVLVFFYPAMADGLYFSRSAFLFEHLLG